MFLTLVDSTEEGHICRPPFKSRGLLSFFKDFITLGGCLLITSSWQHPRQMGGPLSMRGTNCKRRHAADEGSQAADCWNGEAGDGLPGKVGTDWREKKRKKRRRGATVRERAKEKTEQHMHWVFFWAAHALEEILGAQHGWLYDWLIDWLI